MNTKKIGKQTIKFKNPPSIISTACIVGPKEAKGPLKNYFDITVDDELYGEKSWEKAESKFIKDTFFKILSKAGKSEKDIEYYFGGDLLNQCTATNYAVRDSGIPFFGLYGACSTMAESLSLASMIVDGEYANNVIALTSSHFCGAEKQFRFPLEQGTQRPPTAQRTVTGAGGALISATGNGPYITEITTGCVIDMGIKDINNMGAAMAPAAVDCIYKHFLDTNEDPNSYNLIITGDLGIIGLDIMKDIFKNKLKMDLNSKLDDCGVKIFDPKTQDTHAGGSGCGCSAVTFAGYLYNELTQGQMNKIMLVSTGALMSPLSSFQGESIPAIAHAITIQRNIN